MDKILKGTVLMLFLVVISISWSCSNNSSVETEPTLTPQEYLDQSIAAVDTGRLAEDLAIIDDSLSVAGLTEKVLTGPHGVRYVINSPGTGAKPALDNIIKIKYSGRVLGTDVEFDASDSLEIYLYRLIIGFQTTMPLLPTGTDVTLYIPSGYGYGTTDITDQSTGETLIPANSNLVFHVELLEVK